MFANKILGFSLDPPKVEFYSLDWNFGRQLMKVYLTDFMCPDLKGRGPSRGCRPFQQGNFVSCRLGKASEPRSGLLNLVFCLL